MSARVTAPSLVDVFAEHRFDLIMMFALLLLLYVTMFSGLLGAIVNMLLVIPAYLAALGVAYLAMMWAPDTPPEKQSWFAELLAGGLTALTVIMLFEGTFGLFYGVILAVSSIVVLASKPKFWAVVDVASTGVGAGVASFVIVLLLSSFLSVIYHFSLTDMLHALPISVFTFDTMQIEGPLMYFAVALPEEMWARAMMYSAMKKYVGAKKAAFWSTFTFIVMHIPSRESGLGILYLPFVIALIGIGVSVFIYIYEKYAEHPLFSITAHATYNTLISTAGDVYSMLMGVAGVAIMYFIAKAYKVRSP